MAFLYECDILNRYANHTLTSTVTNDMVKWELKDGSSQVIARARGANGNDERILKRMRNNLGIDDNIRPLLTTAERDSLTLLQGQTIINVTSDTAQVKTNGAWS